MRTPTAPDDGAPNVEIGGALAAAHTRRARLLARAGVAMKSAALDRLVDGLDQLTVLGVRVRVLAGGDSLLEPAEERLDPRRVATVLEPLALGAGDPLLL